MFSSIKKIKDKLYLFYIDKFVNNPVALSDAQKIGGHDIDDKNVINVIIEPEKDFTSEIKIEEEPIELVISKVSVAEEVVEEPKKKPGRPKATTKKAPAKKIVPPVKD
jgi:hypothetical protein